MHTMRKAGAALAVLGAALSSSAADSIELFGLEHFPLGDAAVYSSIYSAGFSVGDLDMTGTNGVATILGGADSGAFFFPNVESVANGYFMRAHVYGLVDGQAHRPIGRVSGYRGDYATFHATADYSAIGATSLTFQAWSGNLLLGQTTVNAGEVTIYTESGRLVRVNPWWPAHGEYGTSIQLHYAAQVTLPECDDNVGCKPVFANHIFIRPNGATSVVASISRTDIFGGGGLPSFDINDVRLGMFGHAHAILGPVKFNATNGVLGVNTLDPLAEGGSGVLVEFEHVATANVQLLPLEIALPNTNDIQESVEVSFSGVRAGGYSSFIGSAALANSNGVLRFSARMDETLGTSIRLYSNGVPLGAPLAGPGDLAITGNPRLVGIGATADTSAGPTGLSLQFDALATVDYFGETLLADRITVNATSMTGVADITGLGITTMALPSFAIAGESSTTEVPYLSIARSNDTVILRWPDPAAAYSVQGSVDFNEGWFGIEATIERANGMATAAFSLAETPVEFFRLVRNFYND